MPYVDIAAIAAAYMLGTFPSAQLAGRRRGVDPTRSGSGNPGTTNVLRTAGRQAAALTLIGDAGKGVVAAALGWAVGGHGLGVACGVAAVLGHVAPVTRRFKGGKGVATAVGMVAVLYPLLAVVGCLVFVGVLVTTRIVSIASMAGVVAAAVVAAGVATVTGAHGWEATALVLCAALVVARHAGNIRRLARGDESGATLRP